MEVAQVLLLLAGIALLVVGVIAAQRAAERRRQAMQAFGTSLGLRFDAATDRGFDDRNRHGAFRQGSSRAAYNRLVGTLEIGGVRHDVEMGDYRYTVHTGKSSHTHRFSFLVLQPRWRSLPDLHIRPEHLGDKLIGAIGFDDIDFESEEFSRRFMVRSPDKRFAYAVVHPRMMEYLLSVRGPTIEILQGKCLFMTRRSTWKPEEFRSNVAWARRFFELWPEHLVRQLGGGDREGIA